MNVSIENNENVEKCKECRGRCCKRNPGICHPSDFINNWHDMMLALGSQKYTIDSWDDEWDKGSIYYIRPTIKGREYEVPHYSYGGECTFLTDNGCELKFEDRPLGCRMLKVNVEGDKRKCELEYDNYEYAMQWISYQVRLNEYIKKYKGEINGKG